ncbi:MAG: TIGR00266 family protein [Candidatus Riflebacteria bacterium]|nr:TIGR00266 family protein [Candidatus Riflebacteria bacterium]
MWYLAVGGISQGPFSAREILDKLSCGAITGDTHAFAQGGMQSWTRIEEIESFASPLRAARPLPPVPFGERSRVSDVIDYNIFGDDMQFVEVELDPGESVVAEAGAMFYMDPAIEMNTIFGDGSAKQESAGLWGMLKSAGARLLTGESLFMTVFTHKGAENKARVAFAAPYPGKIIIVDLKDAGGTLLCQKEAFLCGAKGVSVGVGFQKKFGVGLFGGEGFIIQKLEGDGLVFCHAGGMIIEKELAVGQTLKIDTGCIVAYQPTVNFDIQMVGGIKSALFGGEGLFLATLTGPGRVWLQSIPFSRMATRVFAAAKQSGGNKEEGSVLGSVFNIVGGKS